MTNNNFLRQFKFSLTNERLQPQRGLAVVVIGLVILFGTYQSYQNNYNETKLTPADVADLEPEAQVKALADNVDDLNQIKQEIPIILGLEITLIIGAMFYAARWEFGLMSYRRLMLYGVLILFAVFFLFPLVWMVGTSLKTVEEVSRPQLQILPDKPHWENYTDMLSREGFYRSYMNSIFIAVMVLIGTVTSVSLVAFSFSRLQWQGRNAVFALMMGTLMLPYQATLVPQYVLFFELGWLRSFNPITLPGYFAGGATLIFLMRQFMMGIPKELDEAAMIDGANPLQIWWYIITPLSTPAIATISLFLFIGQWNSLLQPLIYLQRSDLYTMPIYVAQLNNLQESPIPWQNIMTASVLFVIPVLVTFLFTQRYFTESITLTGSKG